MRRLLQAGGRFDFDLEPVVDRRSERMGVQERVYQTRVRQRGNLEPGHDIVAALTQGLRASMNRLLEDETIGDRDRVFFTMGSNRLANNYNGWGLRAGGVATECLACGDHAATFGQDVKFERTI